MHETWFEEDLIPAEETVHQAVKALRNNRIFSPNRSEAPIRSETPIQIRESARGIVRVDKPRWATISPDDQPLQSGTPARFYFVRLGFQFDVSKEARSHGGRFISARCSAYLWPGLPGQPQPTVYEVFPRDMYEGKPRTIRVKISPKIQVGKIVEASVAEATTDLTIGTVEPAVVGWPGDDERAPYWELRPKSKTLLGVRHMWLVIEVPLECDGVILSAQAEGIVQTHLFGVIPVGPASSEWARRPTVLIS